MLRKEIDKLWYHASFLFLIYYCTIFLKEKPSQIIIINKCEKERIVEFNWLFLETTTTARRVNIKNVCIMRMHEMHLSLQFNSRFVVSMIAMAIYFHSWLELSSWPRFFSTLENIHIYSHTKSATLHYLCTAFYYFLWSLSLTLAPFLADSIALLIKLIEIKCCHRKEN